MSDTLPESPFLEQKFCVKCGLCCDGTLFEHAVLQPGERGNLPKKIEQQYGLEGDNESFRLPCAYFVGQCTIYNQPRASVCSAFRCQLLADFSENRISQASAIEKVTNALKFREELYQLYQQIFGQSYTQNSRKLLLESGEIAKSLAADNPLTRQVELLKIKCMIFDMLLVKIFKSKKNFEGMISRSAK